MSHKFELNASTRERLYLVKNGVPWDVAMTVDLADMRTMCILFGELDGYEFDVKKMQWKERAKDDRLTTLNAVMRSIFPFPGDEPARQ